MATWAFACRYHFKDLVAKVEQTITPNDLQAALEAADLYTDDMPGVSVALAAESLTRMQRNFTGIRLDEPGELHDFGVRGSAAVLPHTC
jgi:hypothetical protein